MSAHPHDSLFGHAFADPRECKREGEADGRAAVLLRQLDRRFGPLSAAVVRRVRAAPIRELDRFALRLLDAPTLPAVFAAD